VAFQSFVVLVFIWLGDGSRLNKSCLHDLRVPYHHCYRVSSPLLVEFISFWYQSFGSKISFVYLLFSFYFLFLAIIKKKKKKKKKKTKKKKKQKKKKKEKKKVQNSSKKKKNLPFNLSARKLLLFQKEKSLHFNLVSTRK
jgi:flagellar biosynthesis component FlhA